MRIFLLILSAVIPSQTSKEHTIYGDLSRDGENIFFELVKRLGKEDDHGQLDWENKARCDWTPNKSSIIKKKESLNNGAIFLTLYKDVESNEACSARCCQNGSCDLAVFENKENHYCYLFRCEGKCKFGHHSSYVSNDIVHHSQPQTSIAEGSEQDLIDLNQGSEGKSLNNNAFETTAAVTTLSPTTALYIPPHSVGLEGPYCEETLHCEDPSAICSYHRCVCQEGFYRKGHICREVCPPSNFECLELGTHGRGPQCVSQLEVCNSITQCADGSDEYNCPDSEEPSKGHGLPSPERKPAQYGGSNSQKTDASSEAEKNAKPRVDNESGVDIISHNTDSIQPSNDTDHPSSSMKEGDKDTASKSSSVTTSAAHKTGDVPEKSSKENALKSVEKNTSVSGSLQPDENFVSRKKMNFSLKSASMQGPIIALSLGLAFTVILLIFVVCRLRTVRQRLRKGRPLHSNEADYLINGMYL